MHTVTIVGLGPGDRDQMPVKVERELKNHSIIYMRTEDHPAVLELKKEGLVFETFDSLYEENSNDFEDVYEAIVTTLLKAAEENPVLYAVPGHPMVAEKTVKELLNRYDKVRIAGGASFLDDLFQSVKVDPVEGFQLMDSFGLNPDYLQTGQHIIIMQVFNALMASEVKLTLMEKYPAEHQVAVIDAAGSESEEVNWLPLYEIDHFEGVHNLRSLYIPPLERDEQVTSLSTLQYYIDEITAPDGDVWINEQNSQSLVQYIKEETAELIVAIEKKDIDNTIEELGDVLIQILYQTNMAEREGLFTFEEVLTGINRKIRRRHPHVFDGVEALTVEEVDALWQKIKAEEKRNKDEIG